RSAAAALVAAAQHSPDPCHQLTGTERFGDVVVCTKVKTLQLVVLHHARRQHDDGNLGLLTHLPADVKPVQAGQHKVQDHQVRVLFAQDSERAEAVVGGEDLV